MRALPAIFVTALVALVVGATLLVANHFGDHHWPTAPSPSTVTRLVTPTEAAGRFGERIIARRSVERPASSDRADSATAAPQPRPLTRRATHRPDPAPIVRHPHGGGRGGRDGRDGSPAPDPATQPVATAQPDQPQATQASTPPPATQQAGAAAPEQDHARVDDVVPNPVVTQPPPPVVAPDPPADPATAPRPGRGGLLHGLLNTLGLTP
jgi:hypothetical protein